MSAGTVDKGNPVSLYVESSQGIPRNYIPASLISRIYSFVGDWRASFFGSWGLAGGLGTVWLTERAVTNIPKNASIPLVTTLFLAATLLQDKAAKKNEENSRIQAERICENLMNLINELLIHLKNSSEIEHDKFVKTRKDKIDIINDNRNQYKHTENKLKILNDTIPLQSELLHSLIQKLIGNYPELVNEICNLRSLLNEKEETISYKDKQIADLTQERDRLKEERKKLEKDCENLSQSVRENTSQIQQLKLEIVALRKGGALTQEEIKRMIDAAIAPKNDEIKQLNLRFAELAKKPEASEKAEMISFYETANETMALNQLIHDQLKDLERRYAEVSETNKKLEEEIKLLKEF